eukprot:TRINITY_DN49_c0_g1_i9.p2 TRINITY_DN49_c0_g1~~TRINITY_DN49_c0_g1_i9.p2  ORF type:complete len:291 (-),score=95.33 TRINITY_DN49_c0_g1_i9:92-964(-)
MTTPAPAPAAAAPVVAAVPMSASMTLPRPAVPAGAEAQTFFSTPAAPVIHKEPLLGAGSGGGMDLKGGLNRRNSQLWFDLTITNVSSQTPIANVAVQFNKNSFQLFPAQQPNITPLSVGQTTDVSIPILTNPQLASSPPATNMLQVAVRVNLQQIYYFTTNVPLQAVLVEGGAMDQAGFPQAWRAIPDATELVREMAVSAPAATAASAAATAATMGILSAKLRASNMFEMARLKNGANDVMYLSMKTVTGLFVLLEITLAPGATSCTAALRSQDPTVLPVVALGLSSLLH